MSEQTLPISQRLGTGLEVDRSWLQERPPWSPASEENEGAGARLGPFAGQAQPASSKSDVMRRLPPLILREVAAPRLDESFRSNGGEAGSQDITGAGRNPIGKGRSAEEKSVARQPSERRSPDSHSVAGEQPAPHKPNEALSATVDREPLDSIVMSKRTEGNDLGPLPVDDANTENDSPVNPAEHRPAGEEVAETLATDLSLWVAKTTPAQHLRTYAPAANDISLRLTNELRTAFALGRRGALYAAREAFLKVLHEVAQAKDAAARTESHSAALAQGLRSIEESEDFVLHSSASAKGIDPRSVAASHSTPLLRHQDADCPKLTQEICALYYRYAEHKLSSAVLGEHAGSMALFGLGKTYTRLASSEDVAYAEQRALVMYRAAVAAHAGNHLAANEIGVTLTRMGHYGPAARALDYAVNQGGGSIVYRNLALVQSKLGESKLATHSQRRAEQLAQLERGRGVFSRNCGIQWVPTTEFARSDNDVSLRNSVSLAAGSSGHAGQGRAEANRAGGRPAADQTAEHARSSPRWKLSLPFSARKPSGLKR